MTASFGPRRDEAIQMSEFQQRVLEIPQEYSIFLGGGRGGGKSFCCALLCLKHATEFGNRAHMMYLRRSHRGTQDFAAITMEVFGKVYGTAARFNSSEGFWKLPNGATLEINRCGTAADLLKFQGRSKSLIIVDEAGHYPDPMLIDRMRSNLRSISTIPVRLVPCSLRKSRRLGTWLDSAPLHQSHDAVEAVSGETDWRHVRVVPVYFYSE